MCLPLLHKFLKLMKKITLLAALFAAMTINATDLWTESKHVSWDEGGVQIQKEAFAEALPGQKIVVSYTGASDGIEFKVMNPGRFDHLAGSREAAWINGDGAFEQFLTVAAVDSLKAYGLEIIGANFTCTKVELLDGRELKDGITVWAGFFWADDWKTLELYKEGYAGVDWSKATALRIYSEANRTDYFLQIVKAWGEPPVLTASKDAFTINNEYAELALTDELRTELKESGHWMIQFNKEDGAPFNVTDIVLVGDFTTAIDNTAIAPKATKTIENGQLISVHSSKI